MATINIPASPKRYFIFSSRDDTMPLSEKLPGVLTAQINPRGYFSENIADSFYNERLELGEVFYFKMPAPMLRWHQAKKGTASKFQGCLSKIFPELEKISDKALDRLINDMRSREE